MLKSPVFSGKIRCLALMEKDVFCSSNLTINHETSHADDDLLLRLMQLGEVTETSAGVTYFASSYIKLGLNKVEVDILVKMSRTIHKMNSKSAK